MDRFKSEHLEIRAAQPADAQTMIAVKHASVFKIGAENYPPEQLVQWAGHLDQTHIDVIKTRVKQMEMLFQVATLQQVVMGFGALHLDTGEVEGPYVRPEHGREGIGSGLMLALEQQAALHSVRRLFVEAPQNVVEFYTRHNGFESIRPSTKQLVNGGSLATTRVEKDVVK